MKYIKLFESFEDLGSIKDEVEQMFYEVQDLGIDVKVTHKKSRIVSVNLDIEEMMIELTSMESSGSHIQFKVGDDIIDSINRLFNWTSEYHNFKFTLRVFDTVKSPISYTDLPNFIVRSGNNEGDINKNIKEFIFNYKDEMVSRISIWLRRDIPLK